MTIIMIFRKHKAFSFFRLILVLTFFGCYACKQIEINEKPQSTRYIVELNLKKEKSDSLLVNPNSQEHYMRYLNDEHGFCKLENDTIKIYNSVGSFTGKSLYIAISKGHYKFNVSEYSCTYDITYTDINHSLRLNQSSYKINDTIIGEMYYMGIYVADTEKNIIDTTIITGKFKFRVRDENFDWNRMRQEGNFAHFIELTKQEPDTVTELSLSNCNLTDLPKELFLFKNVKHLDLSENNFENTDLFPLCNLNKLKSINLNRCQLTKFPDGILCQKELEGLDIFANDIKHLPNELFSLKQLKRLQLEYNELTEISPRIADLQQLEFLDLAGNNIKTLPKSIIQLKNLKEFLPPDSLLYLPKPMAKLLSPYMNHDNIGNYDEIKHLIPEE